MDYTYKIRYMMYKAAEAGDGARMLALMLEHGSDLAAADLNRNGYTALHVIASRAPDVPASGEGITQLVAAAGPAIDIDARTKSEGCTPLLLASAYGNLHLVRALLQCGASVDVKGKYGKTPTNLVNWCCINPGKTNKQAILSLLKIHQHYINQKMKNTT